MSSANGATDISFDDQAFVHNQTISSLICHSKKKYHDREDAFYIDIVISETRFEIAF